MALAASPRGFEPVDSAGIVLPIDPARNDLNLPVAVHRDVPILSLLGAIRAQHPVLYRRISEVSRDGKQGIVIRLTSSDRTSGTDVEAVDDSIVTTTANEPRVLVIRAPLGVSVSRLADIFPVESDLLRRRANVAELDLRYRDQVIARLQ